MTHRRIAVLSMVLWPTLLTALYASATVLHRAHVREAQLSAENATLRNENAALRAQMADDIRTMQGQTDGLQAAAGALRRQDASIGSQNQALERLAAVVRKYETLFKEYVDPPGQDQPYYITGGYLDDRGTRRINDCRVPPIVTHGRNTFQALANAGFTVWPAQVFEQGDAQFRRACEPFDR